MRRAKKLLPWAWVVIGALIAASLVRLAFLGGADRDDDRATPTGEVPAETVPVERQTVENILRIDGTIKLDPARSVSTPADGMLVHRFVPGGAQVEKGAPIFQVRSETVPETSGDDEPAAPRRTYVNAVAPISGKVGAFSAEVGDDVTKGTAVVAVQPGTFKAVGDISPLDRYRLLGKPDTATVTIKGGPEPFTCTALAVGDAASAPAPEGEGEGGGGEAASQVTCEVPGSVTVFDGLTMSMEITAGTADNALVVPVTAVRGLLGKGTVWVLGDDGAESERAVELGVTDGKVIEVTTGLEEGEEVLRYVPGTDDEDEFGDDMYSEEMMY